MSFLKFMGKKGTELKSQELDLPPLPPPIKAPGAEPDSIDLGPPPDDELMPAMDEEPTLPDTPNMDPPEFPETPPFPESPEVGEAPFPDEHETAEPFEMPEEEPHEVPEIKAAEGPLYIKIDKYNDALGEIAKIKADFEKSKNILSSMIEIKASEDKELESWKFGLEDIRKKLAFIDKSIFEEN